jgi:hypothetical protein
MKVLIITRFAALTGLALACAVAPAAAQTSFKVADKDVDVHGSFQQGYIVSDGNNYLTMETSEGSGAMTDGSLNLATKLTPKLRLGGQLYSRNIGQLGNGQIQLDWAFADYKFNDTVGIRAGKVKTPLGLFNDTQDMEFLHTWALLPQGVYPLDLRSITIAHIGADVYGSVKLGQAGSLAYTAYAGKIQDDTKGGYRYGVEDTGLGFKSDIDNSGGGGDARWTTPVTGLMAGYSFMQTKSETDLFVQAAGIDLKVITSPSRRQAFYADYQGGALRLSTEWRLEKMSMTMTPAVFPNSTTDSTGAFAAASYRIAPKLEVGAYHSRFVYDTNLDSDAVDNHINDTAISGRVDINRFWHVKVEGHFIDGYGSTTLARGFYLRSNTSGFDEKTRLLVLRTGVSF